MQRLGGRYLAIVDSSKTAWGSFSRPFRLKRKYGSEFMLVHLVREPTAVCWSVLKQKKRKANRKGRTAPHHGIRCSWVVLGWWLANLSCEAFGIVYPRHYVRLHYEDLAKLPARALILLFERLLPGVCWSADNVGNLGNRHQLYGNKIRWQFLTIDQVQEDRQWIYMMPPEYSRLVQLLSYLLRLRYGYIADGKAAPDSHPRGR
jgi:hypothetical protein